jgi:hypothetical protein
MEELDKAIKTFNLSQELVDAWEKELNTLVEKEMKNRKTVDELQELADMLPKKYRGTRRIYEMITRIEGKV